MLNDKLQKISTIKLHRIRIYVATYQVYCTITHGLIRGFLKFDNDYVLAN